MHSEVASFWKRRAADYMHSPWRCAINEAGTDTDQFAYQLYALGFTFLIICKTWLREGLPGLALLASSHSLLALALACLISHSRRGRGLYIAYREAFCIAFALHMQWTVRLTALHGAVNTIDSHGGSTLSLLGLLAGHTSALYGSLFALYTRPSWAASTTMLALMAATSLAKCQIMCTRVLESPGVEGPLARLAAMLGLLHSAAIPPTSSDAIAALLTAPAQQCMAVSGWLVLFLGFALPSFALYRMERRSRRRYEAQRLQREQCDADEDEGDALVAASAFRPPALLQVAFMSCMAWLLACSLLV